MKTLAIILGIIVVAGGIGMVVMNRRVSPVSTQTSTMDVISQKSAPTEKITQTVPLPKETDIVRSFFAVIGEHRSADAVSMLAPDQASDDASKQAWAVQFNAFDSLNVISIEPALQEDWTDSRHEYKVVLTAAMKSEAASAPIPYYGWENGTNTRWITIVKSGSLWKIAGIATGP